MPEVKNPLGQSERLTKWSNEPSVMLLKKELEASRPAHQTHLTRVQTWNDLRNVTGKEAPKVRKNRSSVQPKLIRRQAEWRYSALSEPFLNTEKMFTVAPTTFEDTHGAEQNELVLNWQFRTKMNKVRFIDEYVRTAVDEGTVIVRLGWQRETTKVKVQVPVMQYLAPTDQAQVDMLQQAIELKAANPRGFEEQAPEELKAAVAFFEETGQMSVAVIAGYQDAEEEKILENKPTLDILDPSNVFIDPSCNGDIERANFVIVSFETSKAELLKDGRYKNLNSINWSGNVPLSQPDHQTQTPGDFNFDDELRKRVVAYEYWGFYDINGDDTLVPIVATWIGDTMIRMDKNPFPDQKVPFVLVPYLPIKRQVMGEPDAELLADNQRILGAVTRGMIDLMGRSANAQQGYAKGFLDVTNRRRFEAGDDYEFNPGNGDPRMSIYQHQYPEIPQSALTMVTLQNQDAEAMSGVKSFSGGLSGEAYGEVAAGIRGMIDASAKREMNILRRLAKGIQDIGVKMMAMNAVFLSPKEVIRVTNKTFVEVLRDDLKGNFDLIVDIATAEVDEARAQDLGFMLQTMGPNMDAAMVQKILAEIARLKRMPELAEDLRNYQPEPDPLEVEKKQLENEELRAKIAKLNAEAEAAMARATKDESEADLNNLDFVEQETGTKHERDLQKQSEQARANQDLEITKALSKGRKPEEKSPDIEAAIGYNELTDLTGRNLGIPLR